MPPQPPWHTSTTRLPTCIGINSLKQAGHFISLGYHRFSGQSLAICDAAFQEELCRAGQIVGIDEINIIEKQLLPEDRLVGRAPEAHLTALLVGPGDDSFQFSSFF